MFLNIDVQSLILTIFRLLLGSIFLVSFVGKASERYHFVDVLATFKLIPSSWLQPVAGSLIIIVAIMLLLGWQSQAAAALCGFLLIIFTIVVGLSLIRRHPDLECGCFGVKHN